jgi:1-aminocyclopropane-1-carboxylate deaminase/D-cysteine desulfhydrase-like pyridoxal-dependent ACC family enzyme
MGVRVVPFINEFFILRLAKKAMELSGCRKSVQRKFRILGEYYGGRYGLPTKGCMKAIEMMEEMEGIRLEPTYTGKAFHALLDFAEGRKGKRILFWNTYSFVRASADYRELPEEFRRFWRWQYIQS